jgi:hypothetical protein
MKKEKKDAEEALTPASLASLAARIAPDLCRSDPNRAIEAAARLIECAREQLEREQERAIVANERAQIYADAERRDKYGFNLLGGNLSLADAFLLQKEERCWKGKRQGPYKTFREFVKALREEGLTAIPLPKGTEETFKDFVFGTEGTNEAVEETTPQAVNALFERKAEQRRAKDRERKAKK